MPQRNSKAITPFVQSGGQGTTGFHPAFIKVFFAFLRVFAPLRYAFDFHAIGLCRHPSDEHLLPLYVALGAGGPAAGAVRLHAGVDDYVMAMDMFAFGTEIAP